MLRENLGDRRIAITGATGFLGTALTERILRALPDVEVALIVRPGRHLPVQEVGGPGRGAPCAPAARAGGRRTGSGATS
jgi:nucleoside-diphosphate-sugar epimerase